MQHTCSAASQLTAGRQRASTSAVAPALVAVNAAYLQLHWAIGPQVASAWYTAQPSQLRLRPRSSQQVDGGQQPAQLRVRPLLCSQQVDGGQQPAQLQLGCGLSARSRSTAGNDQRTCACVGGSECSEVALADLQLHRQYVRRSRAHGNQRHGNRRSCSCSLSAHSRSTAGNNQRSCSSAAASQLAAGRRRATTSALAPASVAVNAADFRSCMASPVHGNQRSSAVAWQ